MLRVIVCQSSSQQMSLYGRITNHWDMIVTTFCETYSSTMNNYLQRRDVILIQRFRLMMNGNLFHSLERFVFRIWFCVTISKSIFIQSDQSNSIRFKSIDVMSNILIRFEARSNWSPTRQMEYFFHILCASDVSNFSNQSHFYLNIHVVSASKFTIYFSSFQYFSICPFRSRDHRIQ